MFVLRIYGENGKSGVGSVPMTRGPVRLRGKNDPAPASFDGSCKGIPGAKVELAPDGAREHDLTFGGDAGPHGRRSYDQVGRHSIRLGYFP